MDKRDIHQLFQERLAQMIQQSGLSKGEFARLAQIDRSALSQLLDKQSTRLPRIETLVTIARTHDVSLDWLMGLSETGQKDTAVTSAIELQESDHRDEDSILSAWRRESLGQKIRYIPFQLPDIFCLPDVFDYMTKRDKLLTHYRTVQAEQNLSFVERPETDMEIVMPLQRLLSFASGKDIWSELPISLRRKQLEHLGQLADQFYPTVRLFLIDGLTTYAAPLTIFGHQRVAIYLGDNFLVLTGNEVINTFITYFDGFIKQAEIHPHEFTDWLMRHCR